MELNNPPQSCQEDVVCLPIDTWVYRHSRIKIEDMSLHRQIWKKHFGEIPKDEYGVSYEIHHIDGNNKNNSTDNLKCISLQEHFNIHYNQNDWYACKLIMQKLSIPGNIRADVLRNAGRKTSKALTGKRKPGHGDKMRNAITGKRRPDQSIRLKGRKRPDISKALKGRKLNIDTIEKRKITLANRPVIICPHCDKKGKGSNMTRYHFDNCKFK